MTEDDFFLERNARVLMWAREMTACANTLSAEYEIPKAIAAQLVAQADLHVCLFEIFLDEGSGRHGRTLFDYVADIAGALNAISDRMEQE